MSADNYTSIVKEGSEFILYYGCASNDWKTTKGKFDTLQEAIKESKKYDTEYGLSISDTALNDMLPTESETPPQPSNVPTPPLNTSKDNYTDKLEEILIKVSSCVEPPTCEECNANIAEATALINRDYILKSEVLSAIGEDEIRTIMSKDDMQPTFGEPVSGWYRYFAWKPVSTLDRGWRWFSFVWKRKCQPHSYLSAPQTPWFQYRVTTPKRGLEK